MINKIILNSNKICCIQCNSKYYHCLLRTLQCFEKHNRNWDIFIGDVGLENEQINNIKYNILDYKKYACSGIYPHSISRLYMLYDILTITTSPIIVLQLDLDILIFNSIENWVNEFFQSNAVCSMINQVLSEDNKQINILHFAGVHCFLESAYQSLKEFL